MKSTNRVEFQQNKMKGDAKTRGTKRKLPDDDEPSEKQTTTTIIRRKPKRNCSG